MSEIRRGIWKTTTTWTWTPGITLLLVQKLPLISNHLPYVEWGGKSLEVSLYNIMLGLQMWRQKHRLEFQFTRSPNVEKFTCSISKIILLFTVFFIFLYSLRDYLLGFSVIICSDNLFLDLASGTLLLKVRWQTVIFVYSHFCTRSGWFHYWRERLGRWRCHPPRDQPHAHHPIALWTCHLYNTTHRV